ncbi:transcription factor SII (TFIIS) domain containing protein [Acanthamoeba castellanii str. Neff]|uniref:Transcription factor SII (TFIIS) domain containing protein n=1 Tax=Acanthamoeba castellanii (strain ATCC 30010 / Neff) TaxID=1257118 RepID=L8GZ47_ACACF|nr:transcription factor SII (TFIIS) domain containing protein [Acanthamoeba castellanii str. Neff]ELR17808.1 transcription factor SII (TFIIS) domain containing protein [Acanthamoeba castellanii str. Neff]
MAKLQIKAMTMITDALTKPGNNSTKHWSLAQEIEDKIYRAYNCPGHKPVNKHHQLCLWHYLAQVHSMHTNLIDAKGHNPQLHKSMLISIMSLEQLATMRHTDMFPSLHTRTLKPKEVAKPKCSHGMFQCNKRDCHSWFTTYYQLQTRSANKPLTTFMQCTQCNNQYRF